MMNWTDIISRNIVICCLIVLTFSLARGDKVLSGSGDPGERCEIENGVLGTCETAASCSADGGIISRNGTTRTCSKSGGEDYFCCRRPFQIAHTLCESWKSYWRSNNNKCIHKVPMVVGGKDAEVGQFPELAILGIGKNANRVNWQCGGTLVSPHFVLTAAHCVLQFYQYAVRFGEHHLIYIENKTVSRVIGPIPFGLFGERELTLEKRNSAPVEQFALVEDVIIYPEYDRRYHDVALLKLKKPVVVTKRALPACLPTHPQEDYIDQRLTITGWGRIQFDIYKNSEVLQKVAIPVIGRKKCEQDLKKENPFLIPKGITKELICAGEPGKDSCKGDSGGPLLFQTREGVNDIACEHTIVGIVSFGNGCGRFGVYGNVASYMDWITGYIAPGVIPTKRATGNTHAHGTTTVSAGLNEGVPIVFPN